MTDFHTHILPKFDDGSKNINETRELLGMLKEQGISIVAATPHFNASKESCESFLARRERACSEVLPICEELGMTLLCGAEVAYYTGVSRMEDISRLCIGESRLLLLEMPMMRWTDYVIDELISLSRCSDIILVLAHIERYMDLQSKKTMKILEESGILLQCNADFFLDFACRRKAISMFKKGQISFIGSDCHNTTTRQPKIGQAYEQLEKRFGADLLSHFALYNKQLLCFGGK